MATSLSPPNGLIVLIMPELSLSLLGSFFVFVIQGDTAGAILREGKASEEVMDPEVAVIDHGSRS